MRSESASPTWRWRRSAPRSWPRPRRRARERASRTRRQSTEGGTRLRLLQRRPRLASWSRRTRAWQRRIGGRSSCRGCVFGGGRCGRVWSWRRVGSRADSWPSRSSTCWHVVGRCSEAGHCYSNKDSITKYIANYFRLCNLGKGVNENIFFHLTLSFIFLEILFLESA